MHKYMKTREVAEALRTSADNVRGLVHEGRLKAHRVRPRGQLLFSPEDVKAALAPAASNADGAAK